MSTKLDVVLNVIAGTVRGWRGALVKGKAQKQPEKLLKLYDIEVSPFCRLVREVLSELDLDVIIYPCPVGGTRFRPYAKGLLPHVTFPLLVDENSGMVMCESALIMAYLGTSYNGKVKVQKAVGRGWSIATSLFSSLLSWRRGGLKGLKVCPSKAPILPLELYGFESSPYVRPVRARMCELELPYILRNTAKGAMTDIGPPSFRDCWFKAPKGTSRNRKLLEKKTGKVQVPYLIDPNTGVEMFESKRILAYLNQTYAL